MKALLMTNNPTVIKKYPDSLEISGGYKDVLAAARDFIHKGYRLLNHPLAGSIKPNDTPYKSLLLKKGNINDLDYQSLEMIENAVATAGKFPAKEVKLPENMVTDYQLVDLSLLESALNG